ncbi:hypothetical protein HDV02_001001 [Globomyces sp. JEL0801]|nr:hypothetical protein HDV02_001001 [Globomyces sp. JEL0801]
MLNWPPQLPAEKLDELRVLSVDWATSNGLIIRSQIENVPYALHAPFALFPSPFPRSGYELAIQIQPLFNNLVDRVARDHQFLTEIMESLSKSDEFTHKVYQIYKKTLNHKQKIWMGIHRSDYLLHYEDNQPSIKQVELNTIASSFSSLSSKTDQLHHYISNRTDFFNEFAPNHTNINAKDFPKNHSGKSIAQGIAKAFELYGVKNYNIKLVRKSLKEIQSQAKLIGPDQRLFIDNQEIAVTYFRAGYGPGDYPTESEWEARSLIEASFTVKCPNAAYHLVGSKKIQQILAGPNMLEKFISSEHASLLYKSFTGLYPLDNSKEGLDAYKKALANPSKYVLKPQREGGGNNYYGDDIKKQLTTLTEQERNGFILMDLIQPPPLRNVMIRKNVAIESDVISELGIYGIWVSDGEVCHLNTQGGHLMRTKSSSSNEGGVAAGFAVLDSPFLI